MMLATATPSASFAVQRTSELMRIVALPRRAWTDTDAEAMAVELTALLRTQPGTMSLRPIQAMALVEIATGGGGFLPIRVGGGKTLLSLLAAAVGAVLARVLGGGFKVWRRPLLLIPAKLVAKTEREMRTLAYHWQVPSFIRIVSYELLGRVQWKELLESYRPDVIICDEAHRLKSRRAAVTKRVERYLEMHPEVGFVTMSGTITTRSINDYAHLLRRTIADAPIPRSHTETDEWAQALDETKSETRIGTGALVLLCNAEEAALHRTDPLQACRMAWRRRLVETNGVVATTEGFEGASLSITALEPRLGTATNAAFRRLRADWELPDGQPLAVALDMWRHARELGLGFFYRWDPPAPKEWLVRRKLWCSACRYILGSNRRALDSELDVTRAVAAGVYPHPITVQAGDLFPSDALRAWLDVKPTFEPNTVPVWLDDGAIQSAAEWAATGPGIIWTEHTAFATRLSQVTGLPYYGTQGRDQQGRRIPEEGMPGTGVGTIIASIESNFEGRNLQAWSRNLITSPPANGRRWEQLLARTHRDGQAADEVSFDIFVACHEHADAFAQAQADARFIETTTGQAQKILYADTDVPTDHYR